MNRNVKSHRLLPNECSIGMILSMMAVATFSVTTIALARDLEKPGREIYTPPTEAGPKIEICHTPSNGKGKSVTLEISVDAWPAHLDHGDKKGACSGSDEKNKSPKSKGGKKKICHTPSNGKGKSVTLEISVDAWPAHLDHGDKEGACSGSDEKNKSPKSKGGKKKNGKGKSVMLEIPANACPAHLDHGDTEGACTSSSL